MIDAGRWPIAADQRPLSPRHFGMLKPGIRNPQSHERLLMTLLGEPPKTEVNLLGTPPSAPNRSS